jgi:hypothetical protein
MDNSMSPPTNKQQLLFCFERIRINSTEGQKRGWGVDQGKTRKTSDADRRNPE